MAVNQDQLEESLERYGRALSAVAGISSLWEVPALVLADDGAVAVSGKGQIEGFFAQAIEGYRSQELMATRPELERASERSHYILRLGDDGQQRIQVAITEPPSQPA